MIERGTVDLFSVNGKIDNMKLFIEIVAVLLMVNSGKKIQKANLGLMKYILHFCFNDCGLTIFNIFQPGPLSVTRDPPLIQPQKIAQLTQFVQRLL